MMTIVKNQSLAEEITQNTFYKAMTAKHTYEGKSSEFTWLCSIAKNLAIDECRKNTKYASFDEASSEVSFDMVDNYEDQDKALQIHLILHELQEPYKEVFQLRVFGELSFHRLELSLVKQRTGQELLITEHVKKSGRNWIMKISCNIIEDLLPLYVDDMVSEDSRQLVEEHLKACPTCRRMQEEIMRENHLTDVKKGSDSVQTNKMEAELLKKIRCKIRKKRIVSVLLAVAIVLAAGGIGHYWYYDKENYISWDEANISVKDGKVYSTVNPLGRMKSILSVDQKNMFYMLSETMWTHKEYPSDSNTENELWNLQDFQEAYERGADTVTDETSFPTGIEHVYYVDPENVKEAFKLWDYQDEPEKAQQKEEELAAKCHLIWSAY